MDRNQKQAYAGVYPDNKPAIMTYYSNIQRLKCTLTGIFLLLALSGHSQRYLLDDQPYIDLNDSIPCHIYNEYLAQTPAFPGGAAALNKWVQKHARYPKSLKDSVNLKRIYCEVIFDTSGLVVNPRIINNNPHPELVKETFRLIRKFPKFRPGKTRNGTVRVRYFFTFFYNPPTPKKSRKYHPSNSTLLIYPR